MPKRKPTEADDESQSESELSQVDIDFDFVDFKSDTDYIATKRLLQQLFHTDASLFDLGSIADLILSQDDVGSTVKSDGADGDPLGFLAVINLHTNKSHPAVATLKSYLLSKATSDPRFHQHLTSLLDNATDTSEHVGLIIGERVFNMPPQVMPPAYKMLREEMEWAIEENKPYRFSHLLILSRIWHSNEADLEDKNATAPSPKKRKTDPSSKNAVMTVHTFHHEDECIQKFATHTLDFDYSHQEPRDRDSFGTDVAGRMMLIPSAKLDQMVQAMTAKFPVPV